MVINNIAETVVSILAKNTDFNGEIASDDFNLPLTGKRFDMSGMQLYRFLMCIENTFNIFYTPDDFEKYSFRTLDEIVASIKQKLEIPQ